MKKIKKIENTLPNSLVVNSLFVIIGAIFFLLYSGRVDGFLTLWCELIIAFGYIVSVCDIKSKQIPNGLILAMLASWVITMTPKLFLDIETALILLQDSLLGFVTGGGLFLLVYLISKKGLGGGDVKFMAAAGLYIGFAGVISAMLYGSVLAALAGGVLMLTKKLGRKDTMPLAPFLYVGILVTIFYR